MRRWLYFKLPTITAGFSSMFRRANKAKENLGKHMAQKVHAGARRCSTNAGREGNMGWVRGIAGSPWHSEHP